MTHTYAPSGYAFNPYKSHTASNYRLLSHPGRASDGKRPFYTSRNLPILMAVNHITAGVTDLVAPDTSIEGTNSWGGSSGNTGASWHGGVDSDSIVDCLPDTYTAWAQGVSGHSFNSPGIALEIGLRSPNWDALPAAFRDALVRNAAIWWAPRVVRYGIPIRYVTDRNQIDFLIARKEKVGFTDHYILSPSTRSDPGLYKGRNTFPREQFLDEVKRIVTGGPVVVKPTPTVPPVSSALKVDGRLGPATIKRWQAVMGTTQDGYITASGSSLVRAVQNFLNAKGARDKYGRKLVVDGKGILPNLSRNVGPTNTIYALQRYLGTYKDGVLSTPSSKAVSALQVRLNSAKIGSKVF